MYAQRDGAAPALDDDLADARRTGATRGNEGLASDLRNVRGRVVARITIRGRERALTCVSAILATIARCDHSVYRRTGIGTFRVSAATAPRAPVPTGTARGLFSVLAAGLRCGFS
jgi:hypothetical protein